MSKKTLEQIALEYCRNYGTNLTPEEQKKRMERISELSKMPDAKFTKAVKKALDDINEKMWKDCIGFHHED